MKKVLLLAILMLLGLISGQLKGQSLQLYYIDASGYPTVTTGFKLIDAQGNEIRNSPTLKPLIKSDIIITEMENGKLVPREVLDDPDCPPSSQTTFSAVLVCDISNSMLETLPNGQQTIEALKDVLKGFANQIDPKRTEVAITAFCGDAMPKDLTLFPDDPIRPFTNDKDSLLLAIENLPPICAGTNYNAAFLHKKNEPLVTKFSGLHWCKPDLAKYKPVIIFLTDGNHNPQTAGSLYGGQFNIGEVQRLAAERNASVYVIQVGDEEITTENRGYLETLSEIGKNQVDQTPNLWMGVTSANDLSGIYQAILDECGTIGDPPPCCVSFITDCDGGSATISFPNHWNLSAVAEYNISDSQKPDLEISPETIDFSDTKISELSTEEITITARNSPITITGFEFIQDVNGSDRIVLEDWQTPLPITINQDSKVTFVVKYTAIDENSTDAKIKLISSSCNEDILTITTTPSTNVDEQENSNSIIKIIPNPANDFINMTLTRGSQENIKVVIFDLLGNIIAKHDVKSMNNNVRINIEKLNSGNYFVGCFSENFNEIVPFVISR